MEIIDKIISASEKLFMTYGLKSISMDDIATSLGISKKTIYKHIISKDTLIRATLLQYLKRDKRIVNQIVTDSENAIASIIEIGRHIINMSRRLKPTLVFDLKKYHKQNWNLIEEHHFDFIQEVIKQNIERGIEEGLYRDNLNPLIIAKLYVGKNLIIADEISFPLSLISPDALMKEHLLYHLYGILSKKGTELVEKYELESL